ncbi:hypothetical protein NKH77_31655 [Streptomyces sp. M19]
MQLVEALSTEWDPREHHDTYQERVAELVEAKRTGQTVEKSEAPPRSTNVVNLMDALQASVDRAKGPRAARRTARRKTPGTEAARRPALRTPRGSAGRSGVRWRS